MPVICTRPPPISSRMTGDVMASATPFSISRMAMRLPTFSRVTSLKMRAPLPSRLMWTAAWPLVLSKPGEASVIESPVSTTSFFTAIFPPSRLDTMSSPNGACPCWMAVGSACSSTMRISSVAVRPRMSFALAVSCTPGSCTTTRLAPCCWMTGSATPSSLTRFLSVVMFCCRANSCTWVSACGFRRAVSVKPSAWSSVVKARSVNVVPSLLRAASRWSRVAKCTVTALPSRLMRP